LCDGVVAQPLDHPQSKDVLDDRGADGVGDEAGLREPFGGLGGYGVVDLVGGVPVRGLADVPALPGVDLEAVPGAFQHVNDEPLGHALLDPAGQQAGGAFAARVDRLIGGVQAHADPFELVLDRGANVGAAGEPVDRLADHHVEAAAGVLGLGEQVGQPTVPGERDVDVFVGMAPAPAVEVHAAGLDVPEQDGDLPPVRQRRLAVSELPGQG